MAEWKDLPSGGKGKLSALLFKRGYPIQAVDYSSLGYSWFLVLARQVLVFKVLGSLDDLKGHKQISSAVGAYTDFESHCLNFDF